MQGNKISHPLVEARYKTNSNKLYIHHQIIINLSLLTGSN